ncbi:hypothetical protein NP493_37g08009 [Ridgeia piscesae]|uniref:Uncharacterized protein n=1 Tax=Ridgeia piscesae TaxID=27915 RepID=A0AAD9PCQ9_RIDPI|nr:hypothetical protein NP493_37g08009 [Ridgeia piscesae]
MTLLDEASEETDTTGGCEVTNMLVTSDGEPQEQDCDGYDDDMGPLVIDTAPMSPEREPLKADRKKHEHSEVHEPLHDLDINQQDSLNQHAGYFDESTSQNDALNSTTGTLGSVSWSSSALSPSDLPKNKNGGRLISPSKTRRKSDKILLTCEVALTSQIL